MPLNENQLLARLGELIDPNTRKPYAAARAIKSVSAQDDALEIVVELGYPAASQHAARARATSS